MFQRPRADTSSTSNEGIGRYTTERNFQVNLKCIVDLLSNHLYSGPQVYVRELLQNAVDAIQARRAVQNNFQGSVEIEIAGAKDGKPPTLIVSDDGVGLTEDETHQFLAAIGESSKRGPMARRPDDFIGQFGLGVLSCFLVSDEIVVVARSIQPDARPVVWRGRPNGTYSVRMLEQEIEPGTRVYVRCKPGSEKLFDPKKVQQLVEKFGRMLPIPIRLSAGGPGRPAGGQWGTLRASK